jgi:hypothetical protein
MPTNTQRLDDALQKVARAVRALPDDKTKQELVDGLHELAAAYAELFTGGRQKIMKYWPMNQ